MRLHQFSFDCIEYEEDPDLQQEEEEQFDEEPVDANVNIRQYLDAHIMPSLIEALEKLTTDKPKDPIQYIGEYMLRGAEKSAQVQNTT